MTVVRIHNKTPYSVDVKQDDKGDLIITIDEMGQYKGPGVVNAYVSPSDPGHYVYKDREITQTEFHEIRQRAIQDGQDVSVSFEAGVLKLSIRGESEGPAPGS